MNQSITSYYIPQNLNIKKGKIYTLYLNKNTNLDLSNIININPNQDKQIKRIQENTLGESITLNKEDYNKLLLLIDTSTKLYSQSQELADKISKGRSR